MIIRFLSISAATLLLVTTAQPQSGGQPSLASTLEVYVFPSTGQSPEQQVQSQGEQAQQYSQAQIDNFRKAFSACLEAKDYVVSY